MASNDAEKVARELVASFRLDVKNSYLELYADKIAAALTTAHQEGIQQGRQEQREVDE